jgi:predicted short-subunit dehydrogenase-like oxidoreductase (DUF2520 family)
MSILSSLFAHTHLDSTESSEPIERRPERVLVVGAGPAGHALAAALKRAGFALRHWSRSQGPLWQESAAREPADIVVLAVRDEAIAQAAHFVVEHGAAGPQSVLLHCAGAQDPHVVLGAQRERVAGIGLLHPLRSFARQVPNTVDERGLTTSEASLKNTVVAVCGDERGVRTAEDLGKAMGAVVVRLPAERLPAYHAAAVLAAGHAAALLDTAVHLLRRIGLPQRDAEKALIGLTRSVLVNIDAVGLPAALTGPFARGDAETIGRHLDALTKISHEATEVYRTLGYASLDLAHHKGSAEPAALERIQSLLDQAGQAIHQGAASAGGPGGTNGAPAATSPATGS